MKLVHRKSILPIGGRANLPATASLTPSPPPLRVSKCKNGLLPFIPLVVTWSPDGTRLAIVTADNVVVLCDAEGNIADKFATKPKTLVSGLQSERSLLRSASLTQSTSSDGLSSLNPSWHHVVAMTFSPDSALLAVAQSDASVHVYSLGSAWGVKKTIKYKVNIEVDDGECLCGILWLGLVSKDILLATTTGRLRHCHLPQGLATVVFAHPHKSAVLPMTFHIKTGAGGGGYDLWTGHGDASIYYHTIDKHLCITSQLHLQLPAPLIFLASYGINDLVVVTDRGVHHSAMIHSYRDGVLDQQRSLSDATGVDWRCAALSLENTTLVIGGVDSLCVFHLTHTSVYSTTTSSSPHGAHVYNNSTWQPGPCVTIHGLSSIKRLLWQPCKDVLTGGGGGSGGSGGKILITCSVNGAIDLWNVDETIVLPKSPPLTITDGDTHSVDVHYRRDSNSSITIFLDNDIEWSIVISQTITKIVCYQDGQQIVMYGTSVVVVVSISGHWWKEYSLPRVNHSTPIADTTSLDWGCDNRLVITVAVDEVWSLITMLLLSSGDLVFQFRACHVSSHTLSIRQGDGTVMIAYLSISKQLNALCVRIREYSDAGVYQRAWGVMSSQCRSGVQWLSLSYLSRQPACLQRLHLLVKDNVGRLLHPSLTLLFHHQQSIYQPFPVTHHTYDDGITEEKTNTGDVETIVMLDTCSFVSWIADLNLCITQSYPGQPLLLWVFHHVNPLDPSPSPSSRQSIEVPLPTDLSLFSAFSAVTEWCEERCRVLVYATVDTTKTASVVCVILPTEWIGVYSAISRGVLPEAYAQLCRLQIVPTVILSFNVLAQLALQQWSSVVVNGPLNDTVMDIMDLSLVRLCLQRSSLSSPPTQYLTHLSQFQNASRNVPSTESTTLLLYLISNFTIFWQFCVRSFQLDSTQALVKLWRHLSLVHDEQMMGWSHGTNNSLQSMTNHSAQLLSCLNLCLKYEMMEVAAIVVLEPSNHYQQVLSSQTLVTIINQLIKIKKPFLACELWFRCRPCHFDVIALLIYSCQWARALAECEAKEDWTMKKVVQTSYASFLSHHCDDAESASKMYSECGEFQLAVETATIAHLWTLIAAFVSNDCDNQQDPEEHYKDMCMELRLMIRLSAMTLVRYGCFSQGKATLIVIGCYEDIMCLYLQHGRIDAAVHWAQQMLPKETCIDILKYHAHFFHDRGNYAMSQALVAIYKFKTLNFNITMNIATSTTSITTSSNMTNLDDVDKCTEEAHLSLAEKLVTMKEYHRAEMHFLECGDHGWRRCVSMFSDNGWWLDALRVAQLHNDDLFLRKVASKWASALEKEINDLQLGSDLVVVKGESGARLLYRLGFQELAVHFATSARKGHTAFTVALEIAQDSPSLIESIIFSQAKWCAVKHEWDEALELWVSCGSKGINEAIVTIVAAEQWSLTTKLLQNENTSSEHVSILAMLEEQFLRLHNYNIENECSTIFISSGRISIALKVLQEAGRWEEAITLATSYLPIATKAIIKRQQRYKLKHITQDTTIPLETNVMMKAYAMENLKEYSSAIDIYLSSLGSCGSGEESAIIRSVQLAMTHEPSRIGEVVAIASTRLVQMGRFKTAAKILNTVGRGRDAVKVLIDACLFQDAKDLAKKVDLLEECGGSIDTALYHHLVQLEDAQQLLQCGQIIPAMDILANNCKWDECLNIAKRYCEDDDIGKYSFLWTNHAFQLGKIQECIYLLNEYSTVLIKYRRLDIVVLCTNLVRSILSTVNHEACLCLEITYMEMLKKTLLKFIGPSINFDDRQQRELRHCLYVIHYFIQLKICDDNELHDLSYKISLTLFGYIERNSKKNNEYDGFIPMDITFYIAGVRCRKVEKLCMAFSFFNQFMDICESVESDGKLDSGNFINFKIPKVIKIAIPLRVEVEDWVVNQAINKTKSIFTETERLLLANIGTPVSIDNICMITGFPIDKTSIQQCHSCDKVFDLRCWNAYISTVRHCPWCSVTC